MNSPMLIPMAKEGKLGRFPVKLLENMVLVTKILNAKKSCVQQLKSMNSEAEMLNSFDETLSDNFERKYAHVLLDLEQLNSDLQIYLDEMQVNTQ